MFSKLVKSIKSNVGGKKVSSIDCQPRSSQYTRTCDIGEGASSFVSELKDNRTGQKFAVKACKFDGPRQQLMLENEHNILRHIAQMPEAPKTLLHAKAVWKDEEHFFTMTERFPGDVHSLVRYSGRLSGPRTRLIIAQLITAVEALHQQCIIHRDIKPENIFLTEDLNAVLGDFGLAKQFRTSSAPVAPTRGSASHAPSVVNFTVDPNAVSGSFFQPPSDDEVNCVAHEFAGTAGFLSPEQWNREGYSFPTDIFSMGVVMHELCAGHMPFWQLQRSKDHRPLYAAYERSQLDPRGWDPIAFNLVAAMMHPSQTQRYTLDQVKAHPYFEGADWAAISRHEIPAAWMCSEFAPKSSLAPTVKAKPAFLAGLFTKSKKTAPKEKEIIIPVPPSSTLIADSKVLHESPASISPHDAASPALTLVALSLSSENNSDSSQSASSIPSSPAASTLSPAAPALHRQLSGITLVETNPAAPATPSSDKASFIPKGHRIHGKIEAKLPLRLRLPILAALFRSKQYSVNVRSESVIVPPDCDTKVTSSKAPMALVQLDTTQLVLPDGCDRQGISKGMAGREIPIPK